ncbi:ribosomal protein S6 [Cyphellophora europaea CBS 101466]|uniref:Small ribosomal subunit protein bS6m n=1 Tax=Cyphellophora europaea (strain CBS 101466) TaxID=1220924 RepID=W2SAD1_CYPE1|nr:ribosomal protein S6 [Cyphellophora europaea CBS 101466]ETN44973.1 ribosomal protein S6 [Cyphellophora europaea CBS 101466]
MPQSIFRPRGSLDKTTMLYELIAVVRPGNIAHIKEIATNTGRTILNSKGTIRSLTNWGQFDLPRPTTKHQTQHYTGHYFILQFDSSAAAQQEVKRTLALDPRMIRFSVVKMADKMGKQAGMEGIDGNDGVVRWGKESLLDSSLGLMTSRRAFGQGLR